ncbi:MAG: PCRF domain-containing protein [Candidatus Shikimatogenerans bostrichidophilus]|nr:MAG: PCRF domain-containing protein [Candidatus Shikimatogenerans bostrichidophilus]
MNYKKSLYNNIKLIINKYKNIYNLIIGKKKYLKKKYNNKIYNLINILLFNYNLYKKKKKNLIELKKLYKIKNNDYNFLLEIKNNIKKIKLKLKKLKIIILNNIDKIKKNKDKKKIKYINKAIIEIRSGTGGNESNIFVKDIFRMYIMYFKKKNIKYNILNINKNNNGYREIIFYVKKKKIYNLLKYESGVHRVQRIPKTETQGRLHTSAITVAVLPTIDNNIIKIKNSDIKRSTFKSSGAGGQHVNKTESAVRLTHIPTNITVECQEERSQHKNYDKAITLLKTKIYEYNVRKKKKIIENKRKLLISTGDRSKKIRTYNYPQNRITDHRINLKLYNLDKIMNGEIDELIKLLNLKLKN